MAVFDVIICDNYIHGHASTKEYLKSRADSLGIESLAISTTSNLHELSHLLEQRRECNKLLVISNQYPGDINPVLEKWQKRNKGSYLSVLHSGYSGKILNEGDSVDSIETLTANNGLNPFKIFKAIGTWDLAIPKILTHCDKLFATPVTEATPTQQ